jgi:hypothetical protein
VSSAVVSAAVVQTERVPSPHDGSRVAVVRRAAATGREGFGRTHGAVVYWSVDLLTAKRTEAERKVVP